MKTFSTHYSPTTSYFCQYCSLLFSYVVIPIKNHHYFFICYLSHFEMSQPATNNTNNSYLNSHQHGFTFIEVIIAFFILATGILGAVSMQITAQKSAFNAMQRTIATLYAQEIIGKIRSNSKEPIVLNKYEGVFGVNNISIAPVKRCNKVAHSCDIEDRVLNDLYELNQLLYGSSVQLNSENIGGLVEARACIKHTNHRITVKVIWRNRTKVNNTVVNSPNDLQAICNISSSLEYHQVFASTFVY